MVSTRKIAARRLSIASPGRKSSGGAWLTVVSWRWRGSDIVAPRLVRGPRGCRARLRRVCVRRGWACGFGGELGLRLLDPDALAGQLEDDLVVNEPVDRGGSGHWVLEDPVPLAEHEVAGDDHGAALVALGEEREQHLHLVAVLLDVADVVEDHGVEAIEHRELVLETQLALGDEQALDECVGRDEQHAIPALDQLVADRAHQVRLAATRKAEREQVVTALDERALAQRRQHLGDLGRQARTVERRERLVARQPRAAQVALDPAPAALVHLELDEVVEVADECPAVALGELRDLLGMLRDGGQLQRAQQHHERGQRCGRHHAAPCASSSASYSVRSTGIAASAGTATAAGGAVSALTASMVIGAPAVCSCVSAAATSASIVLAARCRILRYSRSPLVPGCTAWIASYASRNTS